MKIIRRTVSAVLGLLRIILGVAIIAWIIFTLDMVFGSGDNSTWLHQLQREWLGVFIYVVPFFAMIFFGIALWCIITGCVKLFGLKTDDDQYPSMH